MMNHKADQGFFTGDLKKVLISIVLLAMTTTQAQESATQVTPSTPTTTADNKQVERIEVIGSRIKRITKEGAAPVKSVGKESMKNSANTSASESMRDSTMATFGAAREAAGSNAAATATVGLRGLGDTRTLVLLNGHRLPNDPSYEAVDLNLIPQSAIERIEVLKDGASALYGSDALGGVINIITKKGYSGNEATVKLSGVEQKGGTAYDVSLLSGVVGDTVDFLGTLSYTHTDKILGKNRDLIKDGLSGTGTTPAYRAGGLWTLSNGGCPPDLIRTNSSGSRCFYRYNEIASARPQINQFNLLTDTTVRLGSGLKLYNRNLVVHKDIEWNYAPVPATLAVTGTQSQPGATLINYRFLDAGNRDNKDSEFNFNTIVGIKGNLTSLWDYDLGVGYGEINRKNKGINGYLQESTLKNLIATNAYDPLNAGGPVGNVNSAEVDVYAEAKTKLFTVDAVVTGELFEIEDRAVGIAAGASFLNDKLDQKTDDLSAASDVLGSSGSNDKGARDVKSVFAEVAFPVTEDLELGAAARFDHFSDFGSTVNPKLSAKYNISKDFLVRASAGTGFKAPTLSQLYSASSEGFPTFIDRTKCATDPDFCEAIQYEVRGGGNKDLKEEKSYGFSVGAVAQPTTNFSISLDSWYTKVKNLVSINYEDLTQAELNGIIPEDYGVHIERDTNGEILYIETLNIASRR
jgi:iron complex outermembrane recepter protein